jgi:hypothetical protein
MAVTTTAVTAAARPQRPSSLCRRRFGSGWRRFRHSSAAATVRVLLATFLSAVGDGFANWVLLAIVWSNAAGRGLLNEKLDCNM